MNFFKALLLTLGAFILIQPKATATNFYVTNNIKETYKVCIQSIGETKEVSCGETWRYKGKINNFIIQIKKVSDNDLHGFISVILPKEATENIMLTVQYKNETFKLSGLGDEAVIPPCNSSSDDDPATFDLSQISTEIKPSKRKKTQQYEEEDDEDDEDDQPAPYSSTPTATTPAYTSSFSSTSATSSHVQSHALKILAQQCLLNLRYSTYTLMLKAHEGTKYKSQRVDLGTVKYIQPLQVSDCLILYLIRGYHYRIININIPHELKDNYLYNLTIITSPTSPASLKILMSLQKDASPMASSIDIDSEFMLLTQFKMTLDIKKTSSGNYGFFKQ